MRKRVTKKRQKITTTIYLRRYKTQQKLKSYYTYGLMDIATYFVSPLRWPLTRKCFLWLAVSKRIWYPFERLGLSVWKKLLSVRTTWDIRLKKLLSVQTAQANRSKKFVDYSSDWSYLFKDKFSPTFHPKTISSLATCIKRSVILQVTYVTKFVYKRIIYGSLLHCSHLRLHIINQLSTVSTYVLFNTYVFFFLATSFLKIIFFIFYAFAVYEPAEQNFIFLACRDHKTPKINFLIGCISFSLDCFSITKKLWVFSSTLNFAWQFSYQWNRWHAILPQTQICKFGRTKQTFLPIRQPYWMNSM